MDAIAAASGMPGCVFASGDGAPSAVLTAITVGVIVASSAGEEKGPKRSRNPMMPTLGAGCSTRPTANADSVFACATNVAPSFVACVSCQVWVA